MADSIKLALESVRDYPLGSFAFWLVFLCISYETGLMMTTNIKWIRLINEWDIRNDCRGRRKFSWASTIPSVENCAQFRLLWSSQSDHSLTPPTIVLKLLTFQCHNTINVRNCVLGSQGSVRCTRRTGCTREVRQYPT